MALPKLDKLFSDTPAWLRLFNRDYQIKTVMRMNDLLSQNKLTQKEICERTGWSKGYVSRLLSGRGNLTLQTVAKFEAAAGGRVLRVEDGSSELAAAPSPVRWKAVQTAELAERALASPTVSLPHLRMAVQSVSSEDFAEPADA